jgi:hypothetical protein
MSHGVEEMKNARLWLLAPVVGLLLLLVGLLVVRAARTDAGPRGADASSASPAPSFTFCDGTYALCTLARCAPIPGKAAGAEGFLSCPCAVMQGDSAGQQLCAGVPDASPYVGQSITSRYHPITSMAICTNNNNQPWAWCLDMPCVVDSIDGGTAFDGGIGKATCMCVSSSTTGSAGKGEYIVVTDTDTESTCPTGPNSPNGFISSATVCGVEGITRFFYAKSSSPSPGPIKIVNNIPLPLCPPSP